MSADASGGDAETALCAAARRGFADCVALLLAHGADCCTRGARGRTPLACAAASGDGETLRLLLEATRDVRGARRDRGGEPLHAAATAGAANAVAQLVEAGFDPDGKAGRSLRRPLHCAAERGNAAVLRALLAAGASRGATDALGRAPLHLAAQCGDAKRAAACVRALLEGASRAKVAGLVLARTSREAGLRTPLHAAASAAGGSGELAAELLLSAGADSSVRDAEGLTAAQVARAAGHTAVERRLHSLTRTAIAEPASALGSALKGKKRKGQGSKGGKGGKGGGRRDSGPGEAADGASAGALVPQPPAEGKASGAAKLRAKSLFTTVKALSLIDTPQKQKAEEEVVPPKHVGNTPRGGTAAPVAPTVGATQRSQAAFMQVVRAAYSLKAKAADAAASKHDHELALDDLREMSVSDAETALWRRLRSALLSLSSAAARDAAEDLRRHRQGETEAGAVAEAVVRIEETAASVAATRRASRIGFRGNVKA